MAAKRIQQDEWIEVFLVFNDSSIAQGEQADMSVVVGFAGRLDFDLAAKFHPDTVWVISEMKSAVWKTHELAVRRKATVVMADGFLAFDPGRKSFGRERHD